MRAVERPRPDPSSRARRVGRVALLLAFAVSLSSIGCPARRQGPEVPELAQRTREVERRIVRVEKIGEVMRRDLDRIRQLAVDVRDTPNELFREPFPLALFKHVAVECLNAPASSRDGDADASEKRSGDTTSDGFGLGCRPRFADQLVAALDSRTPDSKNSAADLLEKLDEFHALRVQLRSRIANIRDIIASNREMLASRRAEMRKLRKQWEERRAEIGRSAWVELKKRFDHLDEKLQELERKTDSLESATSKWPSAIDRANHDMYFTITSDWKRPTGS